MVRRPTPDMTDDPDKLPCDGKLVFDTRREAEASANVVHYRYGSTMHVYICRYCQLWHLSSGGGD